MENMQIGLRADRAAKFISRFSGFFRLVLDLASWSVAAWVAVYLRFDFEIPENFRQNLLKFIPFIGVVQLTIGLGSGLYRRRWRYGSIDEVAALVITSLVTTVVVAAFNNWIFDPRLLPMSANGWCRSQTTHPKCHDSFRIEPLPRQVAQPLPVFARLQYLLFQYA